MRKFTIAFLVLFVASISFALAQVRTITGTVSTSEDGSVLPGVTIMVKGTTNGTTTDVHGNYSLQVNNDAKTLVFSFVGMKTLEVEIGNKTKLNVTLHPDVSGLNEVVVMGYTTKGKNEITGSAVQVKASDINLVPVTTADQVLQGKVPGLVMSTSSGTPGATQDIIIRGRGSINSSNAPLFVIDGVPVVNTNFSGSSARSSLSDLAAISPEDIESITVLKDASATAAYGARGSNGVIVITTKKGKNNTKTNFSFSAYTGYQNNAVKGEVPLTGDQKKTLLLEAIYNSYGTGYGFTLDQAYDFMQTYDLDNGSLQNWDGVNHNWGDLVARKNAPLQSYNLSATGGDKISSFYISVGYDKTEATVIGSDFKRITSTFNYNRQLSKKLKFSTSNIISNTYQNIFLEQSGYFANPWLTKYFMSPWANPYNSDGTFNLTSLGTSIYNTLYLAQADKQYNDLTRIMSNSYVEWSIYKELRFKSLISFDYNIANFYSYQNRHYGGSAAENGSVEQSTDRNFNYVFQNSLDYTFRYHDHTLGAKLLMEYQKNKDRYLYAYGENFPADGLYNLASALSNQSAYSSLVDWSNISYMAMLNYNYLGKYIADFTIRREGSSRFAPGKQYGTFWALGAAWNISQEGFMSQVKFVNLLKVRASYGLSGNASVLYSDGTQNYTPYQALLGYSADYAYNGAAYPATFGNTNLSWEKNHTLDMGIDFVLWNNRINGSLSYYNKKTYDLLLNVPLSYTSGFSVQAQNIGAVSNKGIEANIDVEVIRSKNITWILSANLYTNKNEVTEMAYDADGNEIKIIGGTQITEVGQPIGAWNLRKYAGVDPETGKPLWYLNGTDGETTTSYSSAAKALQGGSALPTHTFGFGTHFEFHKFYFDANFYYAGGNKVFQDWSYYTNNAGYLSLLYYNGVSELMDRWQQPGDITDVPRVTYTNADPDAASASTRFLYDGTYLRLKNIVLGYDVPAKYIKKIGLESANVYVRGTNLFTWVKDKRLKYDPEVRTDGFTRLTTPPVKSIVFGVNFKF
ncbi:MAG: TonB-dependent receptor [Bacteroidales bacterium]|nr:TonB-dependent receptor [Bacteroidales bacterium]